MKGIVMSSVINFTTSDATPVVRHRRNSKVKVLQNVYCAHCGKRIDVEKGEVAIECFGVMLHEEHFTEFFTDRAMTDEYSTQVC